MKKATKKTSIMLTHSSSYITQEIHHFTSVKFSHKHTNPEAEAIQNSRPLTHMGGFSSFTFLFSIYKKLVPLSTRSNNDIKGSD